jgi:hypothetical protein
MMQFIEAALQFYLLNSGKTASQKIVKNILFIILTVTIQLENFELIKLQHFSNLDQSD